MGKIKVYELAKELNLSNTEMLDILSKLGISAKSHLSTLEDSDVEKVKKSGKKTVKEEKKPEQMHIIRRNVRVINTSDEGKQVNEITTNIAGDIKKSYQETSNRPARNNRADAQSKPRNNNNSFDRRNRFQTNRSNIVITRNGKPVEKPAPLEEKKPEVVVEKKEVVVEQKVEVKNEVKESVNNMEKTVALNNNENKVEKTKNVENKVAENKNAVKASDVKAANNMNNRNNSYNNNNRENYNNRRNNYNSQNNPNYNKSSNNRDNRENNRDNKDF